MNMSGVGLKNGLTGRIVLFAVTCMLFFLTLNLAATLFWPLNVMRIPSEEFISVGLPDAHFHFSRDGVPEREIQFNNEGFRDFPHEKIKKTGIFRIALLGDSFVEGKEVESEETATRILETALTTRFFPAKFEVLNFGVGGYGWAQYQALLEKRVFDFSPDVVIFVTYGNDISDDIYFSIFQKIDQGWLGELYRFLHTLSLLTNENLPIFPVLREREFRFMLKRASEEYTSHARVQEYISCIDSGAFDAKAGCFTKTREAISNIKTVLAQKQIPWGVISLPVTAEISAKHQQLLHSRTPPTVAALLQPDLLKENRQHFLTFLSEQEIPFFDLTDILSTQVEFAYFADDEHFNAFGQRILAKELEHFLKHLHPEAFASTS